MTADARDKVTYKEIAFTIFLKLLPLSVAVVLAFKFLQRILVQAGILIDPVVQNGVLLIALLLIMKVSAGKMLIRLFTEEPDRKN